MTLRISPKASLDDMCIGEEFSFTLDVSRELGEKTVSSYTYKIYDASGDEVTSTIGGGSSRSSGTISFGIKAAVAGKYTLKFIVTCNEVLPDNITPYEFFAAMTVRVV